MRMFLCAKMYLYSWDLKITHECKLLLVYFVFQLHNFQKRRRYLDLNTSVSDPASKQTSVADIKQTLRQSKCNNFEG